MAIPAKARKPNSAASKFHDPERNNGLS